MEGIYFLFVISVCVGSLVNGILINGGNGCQND